MTNAPTFERIAQFVANQAGVPLDRVRPDTRVETDLGVTGDDAAELLEAYAQEFHVDLSALEFLRHFGPEGCLPGYGLYYWLLHGHRIGGHQVTVQMLVDIAHSGRWPDYRNGTPAT